MRPLKPGVMSIPGARAGWEPRLGRRGAEGAGREGPATTPSWTECPVSAEGTGAPDVGHAER